MTMVQGRRVWRDGVLVGWQEASVSAFAHSLQRGSLVFDVLSWGATARGSALFRLPEHVTRFLRSAALVGIAIPYSQEDLEKAALQAVRASGLAGGLVRISAFYPDMEPDLVPERAEGSVTVIAYAPRELAAARPRPERLRVTIERELHKPGPAVLPPQAKVAAAYLGPMLARRRALVRGFDEVILLDTSDRVAEAPTANVFAVAGGELLTPNLDAVLDGITRDTVLRIAGSMGLGTRETPFGVEELMASDEVFLTSTSLPIGPVIEIDGRAVGTGSGGPVTQAIRERLAAITSGRDAWSETMLRWVDGASSP
jgi:branched-chain amino acid aminotransferase